MELRLCHDTLSWYYDTMSQTSGGVSVIEAHNLHKSFGETTAVDDLSFDVRAGEIVGLLGPNGAGKTTAIKMLTTLLSIDRGTASIGSHDVISEPDRVRRSIGLAGQSAAVDDLLTVRENLDLFGRLYHIPRAERKHLVEELIKRFRLDEFAEQAAGTLSGGQRRRLDIVATLIANPLAIFLDEPTTGLDPRSRGQIWDEIRLLAEDGAAVLLTTQYLDEADQLADRIILIDKGNVVAEGAQSELKQRLQRDVLVVRMSDESDVERVAALMNGGNATVTGDRTIHLPVPGAYASLAALDRIRDAGVEIEDFSLSRPTLEDVFMAFTDGS